MRTPDFSRLEAIAGSVVSVSEMPGGASTRRYFRVALAGRTAVAMFVPEGGKPEEIAKEPARHRWPFLEVRDLLHASGVDVPSLYAEDQDNGWLLLEDLGDDTLANYLVKNEPTSPNVRERLYRRAVTDLARAQTKLAKLPVDSIVATRAFDADLLRWEIDHFREWGLEARGHHLSKEDRSTFDEIASRLASRIASWPRGFVHRDYQSRNLMWAEGDRLTVLDFQDAFIGPAPYDLVALLCDSYVDLAPELQREMLVRYADQRSLSALQRSALERGFHLITVQRKLKDAGRFVFIDRTRHMPEFLPFYPGSLVYVARALAQLPELAALQSLLRRVVPNFPS
jgi:hypothetical protein